MRPILGVLVAGFLIAATGCYHATIETGLTPSTEVVEKGFASSWINGLVPPSPIETASKCKNGVAKIETQVSAVNWLVTVLTLYIYSPMAIKVTCAQAGRASISPSAPTIDVGANPTPEQMRDAINRAAKASSLRHGAPAYILY